MAKQTQKTKSQTKASVDLAGEQHQQEIRQKVLDLITVVDRGYMDLAKCLSEIYHSEHFRDWGFKSFEKYCEVELDFKYQKANTLIRIWDRVKGLDIQKERLEKIGWTKLREMLRAMGDDADVEDWLDKAEKLSFRELSDLVVTRRAAGQGDGSVKLALTMNANEAAIIMEAIDAAKSMLDIDNDVVALQMISQDWMESQGHSPEKLSLSHHLTYLKSVYGVDVVVKGEDEPEQEIAGEAEEKPDDVDALLDGTAEPDKAEPADDAEPDVDELFGLGDE